MNKKLYIALLPFVSLLAMAKPAPMVSIPTHDAFFDAIKEHCGQAFTGKITKDNVGNTFGGANLVMYVRQCKENEIQIPFYVGDDASRTWILTKTGAGLMLKHDHRYEDGSYHASTMYGGHTVDAGFNQVQSFPADIYSKQQFIESDMAASVDNVWQMMIHPSRFSYRLMRPARDIQIDFDLTNPIVAPDAPWGYEVK